MKNIIFIVSVLFFFGSCSKDETSGQEKTENESGNLIMLTDEQYQNAAIEIAKMERRTISSVLKLKGKTYLPPQNLVSVSVPMGGYLKSTGLLPGMYVRKGETLAVMEDMQYIQLQQDYLTAKAQLDFSETEFDRQKDLNQSKAVSDKIYEQTKNAYESQYILMKSLEEKLKLIDLNVNTLTPDNISKSIIIKSPISGFVSKVNVNVGKHMDPGSVLFELADLSDIHLVLTAFGEDMEKVAIGQQLAAYTNTDSGKKYPGKIILIGKDVSDDNAIQVHCHFLKSDDTILPGMFMNADIELAEKIVETLPDDAIVRFENKNYVFISKEKGKFEMLQVIVGDSENGFSEIRNSDILSNQYMVTKGAYFLLMALKNLDN